MTSQEVAREYMKRDVRNRGAKAAYDYYRTFIQLFKNKDGSVTIPADIAEFLWELDQIIAEELVKDMED